MKPFVLERTMLTWGGTFYPTGYAVLLFEPQDNLQTISDKLVQAGFDAHTLLHLTPEVILRDIAKHEGSSDLPLPSVGTEGKTVERFVQLARRGCHGLMVPAPEDEDTQRLLEALKDTPMAYGQKYHILAIEDLS